jgi:hypothetical protein
MDSIKAHRRFFWAYQIAALCLLILTVSPFTAPFAACDLAYGVVHGGMTDSDSVKEKMVDDSGIVPLSPDLVLHILPLVAGNAMPVETAPDRGALHQLFPLRL